jgi:hypothetical protein
LESSGQEFKTIMVNMVRVLVGKVTTYKTVGQCKERDGNSKKEML